ncbi:unnamed protein product [Enterobius vermicularis]|uniref:Cysteine-rich DPF motif domain-containing protein 1 n=1 Tax=Enterobius vermicularis TaxID=51028 RepID=A0A158Q983_ENTVE|nr:unnamed protein product [Enterobius vermicularis]
MGTNLELTDTDEGVRESRVDEKLGDPLVSFVCCVCGISFKCHYGRVSVSGMTYSYRYREEVYYLMDPFRNRTKVDERRVTSDEKTTRREGKTNNGLSILDFVVVGSLCTICGQPVCVDEVCGVFYAKTYCSNCINKHEVHFPKELVQKLQSARTARQKREAEKVGPLVMADEDKNR